MPLRFFFGVSPPSRNASFPLAALFFAVALIGCHNTCVIFTSNQGGTLQIKAGDPPPSCTLSTTRAAIQVAVRATPVCTPCAPSNRIAHIFLSLRGIDLHPSVIADLGSPDWQQLAPQFAAQPIQLDLVPGAATAPHLLTEPTFLPAGQYRQVRLRLVLNQPSPGDPLPEKNACGSAGFNCVVMADGRVEPLTLDAAAPELLITSERVAGGFLLLPPDSSAELTIELEPSWSLSASPAGAVRLSPALTARARLNGPGALRK
jgi:hypothetical protein